MRAPRLSRPSSDIAPNMTALVDIVMVILIFLMLAGTFAGQTRFLKSKTIAGTRPAVAQADSFTLDIMISQSSDGLPLVTAGKIRTHDFDILTKELTDELHAYQAAGTPVGQVQVVLHPTARIEYRHMIKVYQAALQAGFQRVMFARSQRI